MSVSGARYTSSSSSASPVVSGQEGLATERKASGPDKAKPVHHGRLGQATVTLPKEDGKASERPKSEDAYTGRSLLLSRTVTLPEKEARESKAKGAFVDRMMKTLNTEDFFVAVNKHVPPEANQERWECLRDAGRMLGAKIHELLKSDEDIANDLFSEVEKLSKPAKGWDDRDRVAFFHGLSVQTALETGSTAPGAALSAVLRAGSYSYDESTGDYSVALALTMSALGEYVESAGSMLQPMDDIQKALVASTVKALKADGVLK